jgi:hypothetical protein
MTENKEFIHFCDNPNCPNHKLEMNYERHYHVNIDEGATGGICGILKTHLYFYKKTIPVNATFMSRGVSHTVITNEFNLCDICKSAIDLYKEKMDE